MNSDKIFNPKALEKLRSPDKLDSMIRITGPFALPLCCGLCMVLLRKKQKDTD